MTTRTVVVAAAVVTGLLVAGSSCSAPHAEAATEGCTWSDSHGEWVYADGSACRGTGEEPATNMFGKPACADLWEAIPGTQPGTIMCVITI
jgi:hypothetical protein